MIDFYSAPLWEALWYGSHSFYTANTPYLHSSRKRSPDGATTDYSNSSHPIAAYYSFIDPKRMKGWVGLVSWSTADGLPIIIGYHQLRLDPEVPANKTLLLMVNSNEGRKPSTSWTRPPGRPRRGRTWLNLVKEDANAIPLSSLWRTKIFRGHGAAQRSVRTTRRWWWWSAAGQVQARESSPVTERHDVLHH